MARSKWKPVYIIRFIRDHKDIKLRLGNRSLMIVAAYEGADLLIYSGRKFVNVLCDENKFLYKLGEFVFTRSRISLEKIKKLELKRNKHRLKKKKKKNRYAIRIYPISSNDKFIFGFYNMCVFFFVLFRY
jgi:ribosomal protein S19